MARIRQNTQSEDPAAPSAAISAGDHRDEAKVITVGAADLARVKAERGISNRQISEDLGGVSPGLVSQWLNGGKRAYGAYREKMREKYGVDPSGWDKAVGSQQSSKAQPPEAPGTDQSPEEPEQGGDETALEIARGNLAKIRVALGEQDLMNQDRARLLGLEAATARVIGQLTGELDQNDLQRFRSSIEYRSLVRRVVGALAPFVDAREAVLRVLGHQVDSGVISTTGPLDLAHFATFAGYVEAHKTIDDLAEATDNLVYPVAGRERELVTLDREVAARVLAACERADPTILASKIAYAPADEYRAKVIDRLRDAVRRGDLVVAFTRDFGPLAAQRAAEAFD
jgi:transcriptional regulator with XRE-family HTH domain